ncbi:MAG TPA: Bax inhibitor-1/YccA family protein [Candidatus Dormibacteraeota bacterium]|nr:Bax inhibitor-1/YccA family protein [Candidatus Dormibacteraeota bacterium]
MFRTSNPALNEKAFRTQAALGEAMTVQGTVNKTGLLLLCAVATAAWTWGLAHSETPEAVYPWMLGGLVGGFVTALVTIFKKEWSALTAPIYALLEGLALGGISAIFERSYHGIAIQAVGLTFGVLFVMLLAYKTGMIRATERFKVGVIAATGAIALLYLVQMVLGVFFHIQVPMIHQSGPIGIAFSIFVVIIAALNLVLDFDLIETGAQSGAPKYMEWYGAFAMMVTLIWLYLEILRLLSKARRR